MYYLAKQGDTNRSPNMNTEQVEGAVRPRDRICRCRSSICALFLAAQAAVNQEKYITFSCACEAHGNRSGAQAVGARACRANGCASAKARGYCAKCISLLGSDAGHRKSRKFRIRFRRTDTKNATEVKEGLAMHMQ